MQIIKYSALTSGGAGTNVNAGEGVGKASQRVCPCLFLSFYSLCLSGCFSFGTNYSTFHIINKCYSHFPLQKSEKKAISLKSWNDILGFVLWFSKHTIYKKTLLTLFNGFLPTSIIYF